MTPAFYRDKFLHDIYRLEIIIIVEIKFRYFLENFL